MDECDAVPGGAHADPPRREADSVGGEPLHGGVEVVDPEAEVVERRLVDTRLLLGIERLP